MHLYFESTLLSKRLLVSFLTVTLFTGCVATLTGSNFTLINGCACLGHQLTYECTTVGGVGTVWQGTAFQCAVHNNQIFLRHSQFTSPQGTSETCTNGAISGKSLRVEQNHFVSQVNVTVSMNLNEQTVQCAHNDGQFLNIVGTNRIVITRPHPPPSDVQLIDIRQSHLIFSWSFISTTCPVTYNVVGNASNCGITCPSTTTYNIVTCTRSNGWFNSTPCVFSFSIQTVVCNLLGSASSPVLVRLEELRAPLVHCEPQYFAASGNLKRITTFFSEVESFLIPGNSIHGSTTSYTITYTNSQYNSIICGCATIPASSCVGGMCSHTFEVSTSFCPPLTDISVTAFGTNQVGNGSISTSITIGGINHFVNLHFDLVASRVVCSFVHYQSPNDALYTCSIAYSPEKECAVESLQRPGARDSGGNHLNPVTIDIPPLPQSQNNLYCFNVIASNRTFTVKVEGIFNAGCNPRDISDGTLIPSHFSCGKPLHSLGIKQGIVCYNNVDAGAIAVYSCFSGCNSESMSQSVHVRTCLPNGTWNGTMPTCDCGDVIRSGSHYGSDTAHLLAISISLVGTVVTTVVVCLIVIISLVKAKLKIQKQLEQVKANALYDEIPGIPDSVIDPDKNIAYDIKLK